MYDPVDANKSYLSLFKENGIHAAFKSLIFIAFWYVINLSIDGVYTPTSILVGGYTVFLFYFTWKVKLIRSLRGILRGKEFRDKSD